MDANINYWQFFLWEGNIMGEGLYKKKKKKWLSLRVLLKESRSGS